MSLTDHRNGISARDDFHDLLGWVKASERRVDILTSLADGPQNSSDFASQWDVSHEAVAYHLRLLEQGGPNGSYLGLIQVVTPDRERYRLWGLTDHGQDLVEYL